MGEAGKFLDGIYGRKKLTEFLKGNLDGINKIYRMGRRQVLDRRDMKDMS
jgi:hypothetical protein